MKSFDRYINFYDEQKFNPDNVDMLELMPIEVTIGERRDIQGRVKQVYLYKSAETGKTYSYEELYDKYKKIYRCYNFFELLERTEKLKKIKDKEIKKVFKGTESQNRAQNQIAAEVSWMPTIAYKENFPIGLDFYLCDEYLAPLKDAFELSKTNLSILLIGGSGSGKESFAYFIGKNSWGRNKKYRAISMVGLGDQFVHSELFGHVKGSFTGATETRKGIVEEFDGGTVFFDEIDKLELSVQAKLLRYLETQEYSKLGENKVHKSDCRFVFATSKNLIDLVKKGEFLLDLYYRITGATIRIPTLRDILANDENKAEKLFMFFFDLFSKTHGFDYEYRNADVWQEILEKTSDLKLWFDYEWHGNLREFVAYMKRNLVLGKWDDLPRTNNDDSYTINAATHNSNTLPSFKQIEKDYYTYLVKKTKAVQKQIADISGQSLSTIRRKLKEYKLIDR